MNFTHRSPRASHHLEHQPAGKVAPRAPGGPRARRSLRAWTKEWLRRIFLPVGWLGASPSDHATALRDNHLVLRAIVWTDLGPYARRKGGGLLSRAARVRVPPGALL